MKIFSMQVLALGVFVAALCCVSPAQDKAKGQLPANFKKLGLRDDQVSKIYSIQSNYRSKVSELTKQINDLKAKEKAEVDAILTAEQKTRLKEILTGESKDPKKDSK